MTFLGCLEFSGVGPCSQACLHDKFHLAAGLRRVHLGAEVAQIQGLASFP